MAAFLRFIIVWTNIILLIVRSQRCSDSDGNECDFCLSQSDFDDKQYQIFKSGVYCLTEDIVHNPYSGTITNPNEPGYWFPTDEREYPACTTQEDGAFALGFFASISIATSNVKLDLNGFTISWDFQFYLQQRYGAIIEIVNQPFLPHQGPADFGDDFVSVDSITICNGELGLSPHHGIHSINASNVVLENLKIYDFEVGAIQLNGFYNAKLKNIEIGPSLQSVPLTGYYSNARFLLLALRQLLNAIDSKKLAMPSVTFAFGDTLTLQEIHDNLVQAMDIIYRYCLGTTTRSDRRSPLYSKALKVFENTDKLPDGSAIYGIILNSFGVATQGFGDGNNNGLRQGRDIQMEDINIHDLKLKVNEVVAVSFDECGSSNSDSSDSSSSSGRSSGSNSGADSSEAQEALNILRGPFGEVLDIELMIDGSLTYGTDLAGLKYTGNPLADAQIALYLYREYVGDGKNYAFGSFMSDHFLDWALNDEPWPECAQFVCNGDIMFHTNKGVMGLRMDGIEEAEIKDVRISELDNESPLASCLCGSYEGPHDGGHPGTLEREGTMMTDVRGISIIDGDLTVNGENYISDLSSFYGDVTGVDLIEDAIFVFDDDGEIDISGLYAASQVDDELYEWLVDIGKTPYPNNFAQCNIAMDDSSEIVNSRRSADCIELFADYGADGSSGGGSSDDSDSGSSGGSSSGSSDSGSSSDSDDDAMAMKDVYDDSTWITGKGRDYDMYIIFVVGLVGVVILSAIGVGLCCYYKRKERTGLQRVNVSDDDESDEEVEEVDVDVVETEMKGTDGDLGEEGEGDEVHILYENEY